MSDLLGTAGIDQGDLARPLYDQGNFQSLEQRVINLENHEQGGKVNVVFKTASQYNQSSTGRSDVFDLQDSWTAICQSAGYNYNRSSSWLFFNVPADITINSAVVSYWFAPSILKSTGLPRIGTKFWFELWSVSPNEFPNDKTTYQLFDDSTHNALFTGQETAVPFGFILPSGAVSITGDTTIPSMFATTYTDSGFSVFDPALHTVAALGAYKPSSASFYSADFAKILKPGTSYALILSTNDLRDDYCTLVSGRIEVKGYTKNR